MYGAAPRRGVGHCVVRCGYGHRIISAIAVEVPRRVSERACPVRCKSALDRSAIISVIKTCGTKRVVARYSGRAIGGGFRLLYVPPNHPSFPPSGLQLHEHSRAVTPHPEGHPSPAPPKI